MIRLPWVSRARYEAAAAAAETEHQLAEMGSKSTLAALEGMQRACDGVVADIRREAAQERAEWASRYEALVDKLAALKHEGYGPPVTLPTPEPEPVEPLPAAVRKAINDRASKGSVAWRHLERQAREKIGLGVDVSEVAALILNGEPVEW
jgi:hypothetical protein